MITFKGISRRTNKYYISLKWYVNNFLAFKRFKVVYYIRRIDWYLANQDFYHHRLFSERFINTCFEMLLINSSYRFTKDLTEDQIYLLIDSVIHSNQKLELKLCVLKYIYQYSILYGGFKTSEYIRTRWLSFLWGEGIHSEFFHIESLKAGVELGFFNDVKLRIKSLLRHDLSNADLLYKISEFCDFDRRIEVKSIPESFSKLLLNRNLVIVGPAVDFSPSTHLKGIDKPLVVMTNFVTNSKCMSDYTPDISYYNSRKILTNKQGIFKTLDSLEFGCFKSESDMLNMNFIKKPEKLRTIENVADIMVNNTGPNAIQNIVYDLWKNGVDKKIFLRGVNLFLSKNSYKSGYWDDVNISSISKAIRWHDPFSNFAILKHYYNSNLISPSDDFDWIFNLSMAEYAERLDEIYVNAIK